MHTLSRVIGIWFILLGLGLTMGYGLNNPEESRKGILFFIFMTFIILGIGVTGLRNWARIALTFATAFAVVVSLMYNLREGLVMLILFSPVIVLQLKSAKKQFTLWKP
ncbi:MAG: hypothetical protein NTZ63_02600 [Candidatus Omnitrophica bacterium]|nr:hypothetical protein [Candidatus Omnitrophota bacterium]